MKKTLNHIAIIPDGNRRWAFEKGLDKLKGHIKAVEKNKIKDFCDICKKNNIKFISLWGFSTENWKRSEKEKKHLFNLFEKIISDLDNFVDNEEIKFIHIGRKDRLPISLINKIKILENKTKKYNKLNLVFCLDYGGRDEIIRAINKILKTNPKKIKITEKEFNNYLDTKNIPDIDVIIRTSGEKRLSGFMPFQGVYAELFFINKNFPEFNLKDFNSVINEFYKRKRRFGGN